tara:strand:+ start:182 stop:499 length:318 start_codon:yes stop_codon:yes gene_type:complete
MKKILTIFALLVILSSSSYAASITGFYQCGEIINLDNKNNEWAKEFVIKWFYGFYSGVNIMNDYETNEPIPDGSSIYYSILNYCKANPLEDTVDASIDLYGKITN